MPTVYVADYAPAMEAGQAWLATCRARLPGTCQWATLCHHKMQEAVGHCAQPEGAFLETAHLWMRKSSSLGCLRCEEVGSNGGRSAVEMNHLSLPP